MKTIKDNAMWLTVAMIGGLIFGALFSGCAHGFDEVEPEREVAAPEGADAAIDIIVNELGISHLPSIHWYGNRMDCDNGLGWLRDGYCIDGVFWPWADQIVVAVKPGAPIHKLALAHELCHEKEFEADGSWDENHTGTCFTEKLAPLNERLANEGY